MGELKEGEEYYIDKYYPGCKSETPEEAKAKYKATLINEILFHTREIKKAEEILAKLKND